MHEFDIRRHKYIAKKYGRHNAPVTLEPELVRHAYITMLKYGGRAELSEVTFTLAEGDHTWEEKIRLSSLIDFICLENMAEQMMIDLQIIEK